MKKIKGIYLNSTQASKAIMELLATGHSREDIRLISKNALNSDLKEEKIWETIKDAFTFHQYEEDYFHRDFNENERTLLEKYKTNLNAGEIIILVEEEIEDENKTPDWDEREREFYEDLDE